MDKTFVWARSYYDFDRRMGFVLQTSMGSGWIPLEIEWIKLNTDGAVSFDAQQATIGGILRDANAIWLWGFNM